MSVHYGFYNSVNDDRLYDAIDISKMFDGIISDGVFEHIDNALAVVQSTGMNIIVRSGKAWFNHTWTINDEDLVLAISPSHLTFNRIDAVVLEVNASDDIRENIFKIITGTPSSTPGEPVIIETSEIHQHVLAYIHVDAGVNSISQANIENIIGTSFCPFVTVPQSINNVATVLEVEVFS